MSEAHPSHRPTDRLMIMCGTSPMPILLAIDSFPSHDIVLVHGPGTGRETAETVAATRPGPNYLLVEVALDDPATVNEQIRTALTSSGEPVIANRTLVYGGGTTPMNVITYANWITANDAETRAWYLAAAAGEFRGDDGSVRKVESSRVNVEQIAPLHSRGQATINAGIDLLALVKRLKPEEVDKIGLAAHKILNTRDTFQRVSAIRDLSPSWLLNSLGLANIRDDSTNAAGDFMEFVLAALLGRYFREDLDEIRGNVKRIDEGRDTWEVDLVLRAKERVMVVSSGISVGHMKAKSLELGTRYAQVGGSEAFGLTVGRLSDEPNRLLEQIVEGANRLRNDLFNGGQPKHFNAVDFSELFHEDAVSVIRDPRTFLQCGQRRHIGRWMNSWLEGPAAG